MPEVEEYRSPDSGDLTTIDVFTASRGRADDDWRRYLPWNRPPFDPAADYVLERRNFNRFRREAVPARDAIRIVRERTGEARTVERDGRRWTEHASVEARYVRPCSIVIQRYELRRLDTTASAYRRARAGWPAVPPGLPAAALAPWLEDGTSVLPRGALPSRDIGVVYVTADAPPGATRIAAYSGADGDTDAPPSGARIEEGWRFVCAMLGPEELLDRGEPRWEPGPLHRATAAPARPWWGLGAFIARGSRLVGLLSLAALLLLIIQLGSRGGGRGGGGGGDADESPAVPVIAATPSAPAIAATYSGAITVLRDPSRRAAAIGAMPGALDVRLTRNAATNVYTLDIGGPAPFVAVSSIGSYDPATARFTASAAGPVEATLEGMLTAGTLSATYTLTAPTGAPVTYRVAMSK